MKAKILSCVILCIFYQNSIYASNEEIPQLPSSESISSTVEMVGMNPLNPTELPVVNPSQHTQTLMNVVLQIMERNKANKQMEEMRARTFISSTDSSESQEVSSNHRNNINQRLTELTMVSGIAPADGIMAIEEQLCDLLEHHPEFEPIIQKWNAIQEGIADEDNYDIERYATPSSVVNIMNIVLGATLDVGQILGTYIASKWVGGSVVALSMLDGGAAGLRTWLEAKTQSIIDYYSHDIQGQQEFIITPKSREILNEFAGTIKSSYAALVKYIEDQKLTGIKQNPIFTHLSHSMSKIQNLNAYGSKARYFTKILSVLSSATAGIISLVCGPNTLPTSIAVSTSIGCAAIHHRIAGSNYHAIAARQAVELAYIYWQEWNLIELILNTQQNLDEPSAEYQV